MPKSFGQYDQGAGSKYAPKKKKKSTKATPRARSTASAAGRQGSKAQELVDRTRKQMKKVRKDVLRLGID